MEGLFAARQMQMIIALVIALAHGAAAQDPGAKACPCISAANTPGYAALKTKLNAIPNLRKDYGLEGCKDYDKGANVPSAKIMCKGVVDATASPMMKFCALSWCYVDTTKCPVKVGVCVGAGFKVGSPQDEVNCRTRKSKPTEIAHLVNDARLAYSYHTCNNADYFAPERVFSEFYGNNILAGPLTSSPWSFETDGSARWIGILPDFMKEVAKRLDGDLVLADGSAGGIKPVSDESMAMFGVNTTRYDDSPTRVDVERMFSACINDVGIGRLDICLGDFWVTAERFKMVNFLPPVRSDSMFLVKNSKESETFGAILEKPFLPFEWSLWAFICATLVIMGLLIACAEYEHNEDDFPDQRPWIAAVKGIYISVFSYMNQGPQNNPMTPGGRLMSMGLGLFLILAISAYTANLATFLMMKNFIAGIENLDDAISQNLKICIDPRLYGEMVAKEPRVASLLVNGTFGSCPKMMHLEEAQAAIMAQSQIDEAYAGGLVRADCEGVKSWEGTGAESMGIREVDGKPTGAKISGKVCPNKKDFGEDEDGLHQRRDCLLKRISKTKSEYLMSVSIAIPIRHELQNAVGWAVVNSIAEGNLNKIMKKYGSYFPKSLSNCPPLGVSESEPMEIIAIIGTTFASSMFFVMGAFILLGQRIHQLKCTQNMLRKKGEAGADAEEAVDETKVHQLGDRLDLMDTGDRLDHIHDAVETIQSAITEEEQKRTDQWATFKQKIEQVSQSLIQLEQKNGGNAAPAQSAGNPQSPPSSDMAGKWQLMLKDVREERASAERAWQQVVEERQRVKEQWATMEKITRECREALSYPLGDASASPKQAPAVSPASLAESDDKEFETKMNELQALEKAQLDAAIEELKIERKDVQDSLKQAREMHAEVSAMLKTLPQNI